MSIAVTRAEVEDLFYREAALLDAWQIEAWLELLTEDAGYYVPPNDKPDADHRTTLFTIADNNARLRERVKRIMDPSCHAEYPHSRTRRFISNVRVTATEGDRIRVAANFMVHRFRRDSDMRVFVGEYRYTLRREHGTLKIAERRAVLDAEELGTLGAVSFIL
ncbi:MAG TPA: aromatic-ring-hydroxylating dioxygenase subunit beta [Stellaceae bacterium]|nr:aromatic-ring-hydroxylating dioxygenase subunit beta [Stellaceae bacterium]